MTLDALARRALDGDRDAVEQLVRALQDDVRGLAVRMLWNPADADDATQEILIRVVTRLGAFDFRSRLRTWVYRVATNYLLDVKRSPLERRRLDFEQFAEDLETGLSDAGPPDAERSLLTEEVRVGCTLAMLQCLDRPHRAAYVLGEILELSSDEGAAAMEVTPAAFRKRLQRARTRVETFTARHCGLVSDQAPCRCPRRVPAALSLGRLRPDDPVHAAEARAYDQARAFVRAADEARRGASLYRLAAPRRSTVDFARSLVDALVPPEP
jgi:RNA polymerase sigma factor (sigma-70 family)